MIAFIAVYGMGFFATALVGSLMLFAPLSGTATEERRGAKLIILSPVWPVLAIIGIKALWTKAKATLREEGEK